MSDQRCSDNELSVRESSSGPKRDIPSFIEARPPLIMNPFMRPRPQKATNLIGCFEEDSESDEAEWVQVYLRMKPYHGRNNLYDVKSDRCLITSVDTTTAGHGRRTQHNVPKMYTFSHIFGPESNQKEIFEHVVKENLRKLVDGHNFTLLTYGASGSGKTFTLMGTVAAPGLVPRSLEYVFRVVDAAQQPQYKPVDGGAEKLSYVQQDYELQWVKRLQQISMPVRDRYRRMSAQLRGDLTQSTLDLYNRTRYYVWVSFVEIYNEGIYDLLSHSDRSKASSTLRIREDADGNVYVKGVTQAFVRTGEEAYDVMVAGKHNLQVAATGVHANSSRSHCIFTITMLTETESGVRTSCVRLCDLAGSERAQRTHNTGARMQESRAINKSLHVLERCLHMLHRKQRHDATLVPYRESKLTRLLGAGLSGLRGEAVSMVVTLNPAPEYVHETKHVLQLAVVAKDIQVNSTVAESSIELSTTDTTMESSMEIMKLRAENERLHFELMQAQSYNAKLVAAEEEKRHEVADTMREMVEEAKDLTRQYYEAQLESLRCEMEEMKEKYEQQISRLTAVHPTQIDILRKSDVRTPSKLLQKKDAQIAILEDRLAKAEAETHRLRACIEERDAIPEEEQIQDDVISLTDSESDNDDPWNASLEPTVKKKDIIKYRLLQQRLSKDKSFNGGHDTEDDNESNNEKSADTIQDVNESDDDTANSAYVTGGNETSDLNDSINVTEPTKIDDRCEGDVSKVDDESKVNASKVGDQDTSDTYKIDDHVEGVNDISLNDAQNETNPQVRESIKTNSLIRGTYFVKDIDTSSKVDDQKEINDFTQIDDQIIDDNDISKMVHQNEAIEEAKESITSNSLHRGTYFVRDIDTSTDTKENDISKTKIRGTYFVKDTEISNVSNDSKITYCSLLSEESIEKKTEVKPDKIVNKMFLLKSQTGSDVSLAQFEQLEKDSQIDRKEKLRTTELLSDIKILKEKRKYFDSAEDQNLKIYEEKKTYFDTNIGVNKQIAEIRNNMNSDDRSPSLLKEDITNNFEPSTIKKLLGESFVRQPDAISSIHKNKVVPKKHDSFDIFEGFDSPQIAKPKENVFEISLTKKEENANHIDTQITKSPGKIGKTALKTVETHNVSETTRSAEKVTETASKIVEKLVAPVKAKNVQNENINLTGLVQTGLYIDAQDKRENYHRTIQKPFEYKLESANEIDNGQSASKVSNQKPDTGKTSNLKLKIKTERPSVVEEPAQDIDVTQSNVKENIDITQSRNSRKNTLDEFENISKDITAPRATEFELLVSQEASSFNITQNEFEKSKYNLRHNTTQKENSQNVLLKSQAKCESKPKRNLRLRRSKNQEEENTEETVAKLKDIVNLQTEFSDVTLDVPAAKKEVKDMSSPEEIAGQENLPPLLGIQSCPAKSVTRSRRKLFTPRPEVLEESLAGTGDSNERVRVPRPSYHRATRVRRKL